MELIQAYNLFVDVWRLYKKYCRKLNDSELNELSSQAERIYKKYNCDFAKNIVLEVVCEIEKSK